MKILELNAFHYRRGGSETVFFSTCELLRNHGHEVVDFCLKWPENLPSPSDRYFAESKESRRGLLRVPMNIVSYFYHFGAARRLRQLIEREKPDIAQVHLIWGQLSPSVLKVLRKCGIPVVITLHDFRLVCPASVMRNGRGEICEQCAGRSFTRCVANCCCKGSRSLSVMMAAEQYFRNTFFHPASLVDGVLYVSDFSRRKHIQYMPELQDLPSETIYNTAPEIADAPVMPSPEPYWLYFGRLSEEKGVETLLEVFRRHPEHRLIIAGTGPLAPALRDAISSEKIPNITLAGFVSGTPLRKLIGEASFVVVPSECYENNPLSIVEAYAVATPVVATDIGGIPEIVPDGSTGFLFRPGDADDMEKALSKAASLSPAEYGAMQKRALEFARANFSADSYYPSLVRLFEKAARHHKDKLL